MLRASYQHDSTGETSYPMTKMDGLTPLLPAHEKGKLSDRDMGSCYRLFFDVNQGSAEENGIVDYRVKTPWQPRRPGPNSKSRPDLVPGKQCINHGFLLRPGWPLGKTLTDYVESSKKKTTAGAIQGISWRGSFT